ncbi:hypothetical protein NXS08_00695 [Gleimia sp. 6138-11-ORH1]|uniref:hypothetical protein n=1 Tax=Gleimia sp. 6138-11-ORH1 TaxID=2973937 RepID=UPI002166DB30|nr:hypothetical protein [Gleimia sp. 6138-11-ORH1]MCS4484009.1 hypothetical protein [Gleimia sp. 6138-11-ORH1]
MMFTLPTRESDTVLDDLIAETIGLLDAVADAEENPFEIEKIDLDQSKLKVFKGTCHCSLSSPGTT